jgi:hypothetical protein
MSYLFKGMYTEALAEYDVANKIARQHKPREFYAFALARAGQKDAALNVLEDVRSTNDYSPAEVAVGCIAVGNTDEAFAMLERAYQERDLQLQYLRVDPHYDDIRQDPRFQNLLVRVGLVQSN